MQHRRLSASAAVLPVLLGLAASAAASTGPAPADPDAALQIHEHRLGNGLQLIVVPLRTAPEIVAWRLWLGVGSGAEAEPGRTGFAHFVEHLMFLGTPTWSAGERGRELQRLGVDENAWTWLDETVYHAILPATSLPAYAAIEGDRFQHLELTVPQLQREAGAVAGEFRKGRSDPGVVLEEHLRAAAFTVHPYGHDTIGLQPDIAAMPEGHEAVLSFLDRHYRPDRATLLIVGDVSPEPVIALIEEAFGGWAPGTTAPPPIPEEPAQTAERRVAVPWADELAPRIALAWKIPAHDPTDPQIAALELAAQLLLSPTGRLKERLIREEGLALSVLGEREATVDPGLLRIEVIARSSGDLQAIETIVREEVAALASGIDPGQLDAVRSHLRYRRLSSLDQPAAIADLLGAAARRGSGTDALAVFDQALSAITPDDVEATAAAWLIDRSLTVAWLSAGDPDSPGGAP